MADPTSVKLTRQELYDRVWTTPVWKLGPELGLSGRGLGKLCGREGIPVPRRGYWAKKAAGWNPTQVKLPARKADQSADFTFWPDPEPEGPAKKAPAPKPLPPDVPVAADLVSSHRLVKAAAASYRKAKPDKNGLLERKSYEAVGMDVSPASLDRALRILDALFRHLEVKGAKIRVSNEPGHRTEIAFDDVVLELRLDERLKRSDRVLSPDEERRKARGEYVWVERYSYTPRGVLRLRLTSGEYHRDRGQWGDTRKPLERRLGEVVLGIEAAVLAIRRERIEEKEAQERRREQERLAWIASQRRQLEATRREAFDKILASWERSRAVAALAGELRIEAARRGMDCSAATRFGRWLAWADRYAVDANPVNWRLEALPDVHRSTWSAPDSYKDDKGSASE